MSENLRGFVRVLIVAVLATVVVSAAFLAGFVASSSLAAAPPAAAGECEESFDLFWEAWHVLKRDFYGELPSPKGMTYGAIRGVLATLDDEHTVLVDPQQAAIFREDMKGSFEGIGATVRMRADGRLVIVQPLEGQPAAKAGLMPGDIVLKVDEAAIKDMSIIEAISLIRGPAGTKVRLTILRPGVEEPLVVEITRQKIEIQIVETRMLEGQIAYVKLTEFSTGATEKFKEALQSLSAQEPRGLIFDLRGNPGGLLDEAIGVGSQFAGEGPILLEKRKGEEEKEYPTQGGGLALDIPLVVLINEGTASASEIVAGAIQDSGRGVLIGDRSFGKGSVQIPHTLSDGSELHVTVAHWLTPGGYDIEGKGLIPDIVVKMTREDFAAGRDPQLDRAIEYLSR
ncbi:MAG: S41 family peptidase [Chloroflexota bacterium]|nr:S41 family peptidase [Chloroflexota bacterium]